MGASEKKEKMKETEMGGEGEENVKYPYSVFFIIGNEFCERFSYYGMKSILSLYLKKKLHFSEDKATTIYHTFSTFCYFTPILGAWIADQLLGKFKTIVYISMFYILGHILKTVAAVPNLGIDPYSMTFVGLALIAIGTGGIKPCVAAFGGDQFKLPEQERHLQTFFTVFYFSINAGSFISTIVTPVLREDVHCFGEKTCYSLAFGVPAALMAIATVIIIMGKPLYKMNPPQGNVVFKVVGSIFYGLIECIKSINMESIIDWFKNLLRFSSEPSTSHWMDVAKPKYGDTFVEDVKCFLRVIVLFLPVPIWWTLFDQTGSRWTFQATRMYGGGFIKPDQMQVANPVLILILLPVFDRFVYPLCAKCNFLKKPLQRMIMGGILCALSFVISGILELKLQTTYAIIPASGFSDINMMSNIPCPVEVKLFKGDEITFEKTIENFENKIEHNIESGVYSLAISVDDTCLPQIFTQRTAKTTVTLASGKVIPVILGHNGGNIETKIVADFDEPKKDNDANSKLRVIYDLDYFNDVDDFHLMNTAEEDGKPMSFNLTDSTGISSTEFHSMDFGTYSIMLNGNEIGGPTLDQGGVYNLLVARDPKTNRIRSNLYTVTTPNSIHILWQVPQYFVITASEVMFSVTGLEFSYSQAPASMKSVLQAAWLLTVAFGNIIVIIVAEAKDSSLDQAEEFFMFAGLMLADTLWFMWLAKCYVPRKEIEEPSKNDIQMSNDGLSNRNFKSDTDF